MKTVQAVIGYIIISYSLQDSTSWSFYLKDFCDTLEQGTLSVVLLNTFAGVIPLAAPRVKSLAGLNDGSLPGLKKKI